MGQLKDRFGDTFANSWASSNGIREDDNGQYRATEDVQDGIVRAAGRMTPEDKAARRESRLAKTEASRLKRIDGADGTKPDGKITPEEEAADRAVRDQRMKDRIINLEQTDVNTGERFRPDTNEDGVIDEAERAEQNRRIGNVEPTYTSPRDRRRNEAFEDVGLRAPRPGETSARDVIMADTEEEYQAKVKQINEEFANRDRDAAAVRERADAFEAQVPGVMEPTYIPGQALDVEAAMSRKIEEIMPGIMSGDISIEEGTRQLMEIRNAVTQQTDPTPADRQKLMDQAMDFGPVPPDGNVDPEMVQDMMRGGSLDVESGPLGGGSMLPPVAGKPLSERDEQLGGLADQPIIDPSREEPPNFILSDPRFQDPDQGPGVGSNDPLDILERQQQLKEASPDFGPRGGQGQNNFLRDYFGGGGGQPAFAQAGMTGQMVPTQLSGGQTIQYYDGMGNPIYG